MTCGKTQILTQEISLHKLSGYSPYINLNTEHGAYFVRSEIKCHVNRSRPRRRMSCRVASMMPGSARRSSDDSEHRRTRMSHGVIELDLSSCDV